MKNVNSKKDLLEFQRELLGKKINKNDNLVMDFSIWYVPLFIMSMYFIEIIINFIAKFIIVTTKYSGLKDSLIFFTSALLVTVVSVKIKVLYTKYRLDKSYKRLTEDLNNVDNLLDNTTEQIEYKKIMYVYAYLHLLNDYLNYKGIKGLSNKFIFRDKANVIRQLHKEGYINQSYLKDRILIAQTKDELDEAVSDIRSSKNIEVNYMVSHQEASCRDTEFIKSILKEPSYHAWIFVLIILWAQVIMLIIFPNIIKEILDLNVVILGLLFISDLLRKAIVEGKLIALKSYMQSSDLLTMLYSTVPLYAGVDESVKQLSSNKIVNFISVPIGYYYTLRYFRCPLKNNQKGLKKAEDNITDELCKEIIHLLEKAGKLDSENKSIIRGLRNKGDMQTLLTMKEELINNSNMAD